MEKPMRSQSVMIVPIKKHSKKVWMSLQLEVDLSGEKEDNEGSPGKKKTIGYQASKFKKNKNAQIPLHLSKGWNYNDQNLARIFSEFLAMKLEILHMGIQTLEKNDKCFDILHFAKQISKRKTYKQLVKGIGKEVCGLLGFKECGLLFYDKKSHSLFTVSTGNDAHA